MRDKVVTAARNGKPQGGLSTVTGSRTPLSEFTRFGMEDILYLMVLFVSFSILTYVFYSAATDGHVLEQNLLLIGMIIGAISLTIFIFKRAGFSMVKKPPIEIPKVFLRERKRKSTYLAIFCNGILLLYVAIISITISEDNLLTISNMNLWIFVAAAGLSSTGFVLLIFHHAKPAFITSERELEEAVTRSSEQWVYFFLFIVAIIGLISFFIIYTENIQKDPTIAEDDKLVFGSQVTFMISIAIVQIVVVGALVLLFLRRNGLSFATPSGGGQLTLPPGFGGGYGGGDPEALAQAFGKALGGTKLSMDGKFTQEIDTDQINKFTGEGSEKGKSKSNRELFPFTGIVGQDNMKKALVLNAINPKVGGVLIRGEKGCGKSVSVRGLTEILPDIEVVEGCRFSCDPKWTTKLCWECQSRRQNGPLPVARRPIKVVELPLNATEDRVVGSFDIEEVLTQGLTKFEPGILAEANRGILYVDEINLLDDYLVDVLLDAAAMGVVTVEREGVSVSYPANFIIVGSMNPEEGELRPQLLDRIALVTEIKGLKDPSQRVEIVTRGREFNDNPTKFRKKYQKNQNELKVKIIKARRRMPRVRTPDNILKVIAKICTDFNVDGHRADMIIERVARTIAALEGRNSVIAEDVIEAAELALPHRMRRKPFEEEEFSVDLLRTMVIEDAQR